MLSKLSGANPSFLLEVHLEACAHCNLHSIDLPTVWITWNTKEVTSTNIACFAQSVP